MAEKQVLLVNDLAGYGKVALSVMIPVLSHMGVNVHNLPTAIASNTLDYGKFQILDTTDYMKNTLAVWDALGFSFDAVATGFIVNKEQAELVAAYCKQQQARGVAVLCDPIMGDDGHLYPGMNEETVENLRGLAACADYVLPNYTEAALLTGHPYQENPSAEEIDGIVQDLRALGAKSVIITSVVQDGVHQVCGYDHRNDRRFALPFSEIPVRFPGTGDIFSAVLLGGILKNEALEDSVARAMRTVRAMIARNLENPDKFRGINIESCLEEIDA